MPNELTTYDEIAERLKNHLEVLIFDAAWHRVAQKGKEVSADSILEEITSICAEVNQNIMSGG